MMNADMYRANGVKGPYLDAIYPYPNYHFSQHFEGLHPVTGMPTTGASQIVSSYATWMCIVRVEIPIQSQNEDGSVTVHYEIQYSGELSFTATVSHAKYFWAGGPYNPNYNPNSN